MRCTIVVKEIKAVYHEIEVDVPNDSVIGVIENEIDMQDFNDIEEIADYIDEVASVYAVDNNFTEISKEFSCEDIYEEY